MIVSLLVLLTTYGRSAYRLIRFRQCIKEELRMIVIGKGEK